VNAAASPVSLRTLPLAGAVNLRDMGGYTTADGRRVRSGMLYRSGRMSMLSADDEAHMATLGIRVVCDLRNVDERTRHPTRWCDAGGTTLWARDYADHSGQLDLVINNSTATADDAHAAMVDLYRVLPFDHMDSYRWMFAQLLAGEVPLLFNCTAGKDRTGVAAALLLQALGVSYDQIVTDYLATNDADLSVLTRGHDGLNGMADAVGARLLAADAAYLAAAWNALDQRYGDVDAYLAHALGIDGAARDRLRALLLD